MESVQAERKDGLAKCALPLSVGAARAEVNRTARKTSGEKESFILTESWVESVQEGTIVTEAYGIQC